MLMYGPHWALKAGFISITWSIEASPLGSLYSHRSVRSTSRQWFASLPVLTTISRCCSCHRHVVHLYALQGQRTLQCFRHWYRENSTDKIHETFFDLNQPSLFSYHNLSRSCSLIPSTSVSWQHLSSFS